MKRDYDPKNFYAGVYHRDDIERLKKVNIYEDNRMCRLKRGIKEALFIGFLIASVLFVSKAYGEGGFECRWEIAGQVFVRFDARDLYLCGELQKTGQLFTIDSQYAQGRIYILERFLEEKTAQFLFYITESSAWQARYYREVEDVKRLRKLVRRLRRK